MIINYGIDFHGEFEDLQITTFPGGEPNIKLGNLVNDIKGNPINLYIRLVDFNSLGRLLIAVDTIKRAGGQINDIFIPYIPGGRQDRLFEGQAFTLKVYADIINSIGARKIITYDIHSEVTRELIKNIEEFDSYTLWNDFVHKYDKETTLIVAPDKGSYKRVILYEQDGYNVVYGEKYRNIETNKIEGLILNIDKHYKDIIVIDDICDGGKTFIELGKLIKPYGDNITLLVTHGIFSKGLDELNKYYNLIETKNSFNMTKSII